MLASSWLWRVQYHDRLSARLRHSDAGRYFQTPATLRRRISHEFDLHAHRSAGLHSWPLFSRDAGPVALVRWSGHLTMQPITLANDTYDSPIWWARWLRILLGTCRARPFFQRVSFVGDFTNDGHKYPMIELRITGT